MINSLIKSKVTQAVSKTINIYKIVAFQYCYYVNENPRTFKLYIKISSVEIFEFLN